jgi:ankyrin repeat protein
LSPRLLPILDFLIKQGADIRRFGGVALGNALDHNNLPAVKLLLISGVDINSWIPDHGTPICIAAANCSVQTVEYLVNAGAEVNAGNHRKTGRTALLAALEGKKWTTAKFLLQRGADAQINNSSGKTLLEASLSSGRWNDIPVTRRGRNVRNFAQQGSSDQWSTQTTSMQRLELCSDIIDSERRKEEDDSVSFGC